MGPRERKDSMIDSLRCDERISEPRQTQVLGGVYDSKSAKIYAQAADNLNLTKRVLDPGQKTLRTGAIISEGNQAVYVEYYKPEENRKYWTEVERLQNEANS